MCKMDEFNLVKKCVQSAMEQVYTNDKSLIARDTNERSIVFRFGLYLCEILKSTAFNNYNVDVEYNRNGQNPKRTPRHPRNGVVPDLIIHKRESNESNLLVLEFKTEWNSNQSEDEKKIKELTSITGEYRFKYGATILIRYNKPDYTWYGEMLRDNKL